MHGKQLIRQLARWRYGIKHYKEAAIAKYGNAETWANVQVDRLKAWGWNTIGAWSHWQHFRERVPYTVIIYTGKTNWENEAPVDYFEESFATWVADYIKDKVEPYVEETYLIGCFLTTKCTGGLTGAALTFSLNIWRWNTTPWQESGD